MFPYQVQGGKNYRSCVNGVLSWRWGGSVLHSPGLSLQKSTTFSNLLPKTFACSILVQRCPTVSWHVNKKRKIFYSIQTVHIICGWCDFNHFKHIKLYTYFHTNARSLFEKLKMGKYFDGNVIISMCLVSAVFVNCIPTSVLINSKASNTADNNKGNFYWFLFFVIIPVILCIWWWMRTKNLELNKQKMIFFIKKKLFINCPRTPHIGTALYYIEC